MVILDWVGTVLIFFGSVLTLIATIGALRVPDVFSLQHIATKPQVMSLILLMFGVMLVVRDSAVTWTLLAVIGFQLVTSPISAHVISRAAYRTRRPGMSAFDVDELDSDLLAGGDLTVD
ncbi:monovalent cation/H(+) antiporter subunit G [Arcanobacterium pinnipediorum]|uniref:Monovalent cation/H(+) antiporter subunit G n=1 Tax=Arcanobacterium pinnipediorum TaxID=1503041 RepID=A0ABY5AJI8_9ACTO|nr:monovalent cation/H(+) antiporter subunit G [Arcanobacterium pinnipediorum]USR80272.1 monovalent cation/H(+) antiporter subunit G [Arcanobacterium pinnipediorum]